MDYKFKYHFLSGRDYGNYLVTADTWWDDVLVIAVLNSKGEFESELRLYLSSNAIPELYCDSSSFPVLPHIQNVLEAIRRYGDNPLLIASALEDFGFEHGYS